ncbi:MAG: 4-deoxy-4-formamido-L-arabinose-phosphoundecaprenol deformylase [Zoogloeaceae bacterium]|jgi:peptidoglycan/xylan/chitin deacetylase (PgdA/CDA1 family)|nr:4-deoxy-4-formamido-L-arabinose-phosphoundecaprenol deformylase [Zoogloeaceae bacterium]
MKLALKIDAATFRGSLIGVPRLVDALRQARAQATFCFNLGPDRSGRRLGACLREGRKGASALSRHGLAGLFYGALLPAPDIGRRCAGILRGVRDAGFETGALAWDAAVWQSAAATAAPAWTESHMRLAFDRHAEIFGAVPAFHAAAGWQTNAHAMRMTQRLGFSYAADTRGSHPYIPVWNAEITLCPQLPTTLPTLDELLDQDGCNVGNVYERLLALTAHAPPTGHVFTVPAELAGQALLPVFVKLLEGWKQQGYELVSLGALRASLDVDRLPRHEVVRGALPGRDGSLMLQGPEFLA